MIRIGYSAVLIALALSSGYFVMSSTNSTQKPVVVIEHSRCTETAIDCEPSDIEFDLKGSNLALLYADLCDRACEVEKAKQFFEKAIEIRKKILGSSNRKTLEANAKYVEFLMMRMQYANAEVIAKEGMEAVKKVPGDLWIVGNTERYLDTLLHQQKYSQALEVERELLKLNEKYCPQYSWMTKEKIESIKSLIKLKS